MKKLYRNYIQNFQGLSKEIWFLSLVTFINRAGAMVIPFLSLYLVNDKGFSLPEVGWIMTCFGLGSIFGTLLGGTLTDRFGFYIVIVASLFFGGIAFVLVGFLQSFFAICLGIFLLIFIADAYRPAIFVACEAYSKPGNVTRAIALLRLAINLGFSIGPLMGGIIITSLSYGSLFWIDGISCVIAAVMLFMMLRPKKIDATEQEAVRIKQGRPPLKNGVFVLLLIIMVTQSIVFVQYFSVVPLYYEKAHFLTPDLIGWLLFLNGAMIVIFEMPLIGWLERKKISKSIATLWGVLLLAASLFILNVTPWSGILIFGMLLMTLGEMIGSPFSSALALEMAPKGRKGNYMAYFSMTFSVSHLVGHNTGMNLVDTWGFEYTWYAMSGFLVLIAVLTLGLYRQLKNSPTYEST
ncbi:MDR family MFS transporter [Altibacter sp. HG106]|uniref:MDR family MFS transporter n=1 Tax=Altibacter sp. HG106 TaxID=3023937 RepID=UPI002350BEE9|nr:MFS transporter [Altibacter sp. HG106]MDC7995784.1 MFS transporter [Altibacter sp. HG106]